ncbi:hypothetical protein HDU96_003743 [Phlyctochytrium bullatum]|nr:hypothetical protein HDU96_003743 [Phlyctochytrium bullatum]
MTTRPPPLQTGAPNAMAIQDVDDDTSDASTPSPTTPTNPPITITTHIPHPSDDDTKGRPSLEKLNPTPTADDETDDDLDAVLVPLPPLRFYLVLAAILLILFLSQLDTSIVATALKAIVADLGDAPMIPWIGSAYLLTCTASAALYGRMSDVVGRKPVILFAIAVFAVGSIVCSYCTTMEGLIIGRAVAGVGGGGIATMMFILISDIVSLRYRTWYQGLANTTSGIAAMVGPVVGGALSDKVSWRWCFLVNIPIGAVAFIILAFCVTFPRPTTSGPLLAKLRRVDWLGMLLLTGTIVAFVTPLQLGGSVWEWDEPRTIGTFAASAVLLGVFIAVELKVASDPFVQPRLFGSGGVVAMFAVAGCLGFTFFSVPYYISLFFQMCYGSTAIEAGLYSIPLVIGSTLASLIGGYYISRTGHYLLLMYLGSLWQLVGILLVTFLRPNSHAAEQTAYLFITGVGLGLIVCTRLIAVQVIVRRADAAVATGLSQFFRLLGGTLGIAVTGTIFNNALEAGIAERLDLDDYVWEMIDNSTDPGEARRTLNFVSLRTRLPNEGLVGSLVEAFLFAFRIAYRSMLPYPLIIFLLAVLVVRRQKARGGLARLHGGGKKGKEDPHLQAAAAE